METLFAVQIGALWVVVLLLLWLVLYRKHARANLQATHPVVEQLEPLRGQRAPDFVAFTPEHALVTRETYQDQETLLLFLSTTCPHCRNMVPEIERVGATLLRRGGKVALVFAESEEVVMPHYEELGLSLPVLIAPRETTTFSRDYTRGGGVPSFVAIDREGAVVYEGRVNMREESWKALVREWQIYPTLGKNPALYRA